MKINIYNSIGEVVETLVNGLHQPGNYEVSWNAKNYPSGIYFYSFEVSKTDGVPIQREVKKIVYLK